MRILFRGMVLLASAGMMLGVAAWGQAATAEKQPPTSFDVALTYDATQANNVPGKNFWMQGGSVQMHAQFWRGLGVVADVSGMHTASVSGSGVGLDMVTATFGPRYTWSLRPHHMQLFGQALVGEANGLHSVFPGVDAATDNANNVALQVGGGMNMPFSRHFAVRAFEASWLRTSLPNGATNVQNNLRLGAGIVFRR